MSRFRTGSGIARRFLQIDLNRGTMRYLMIQVSDPDHWPRNCEPTAGPRGSPPVSRPGGRPATSLSKEVAGASGHLQYRVHRRPYRRSRVDALTLTGGKVAAIDMIADPERIGRLEVVPG